MNAFPVRSGEADGAREHQELISCSNAALAIVGSLSWHAVPFSDCWEERGAQLRRQVILGLKICNSSGCELLASFELSAPHLFVAARPDVYFLFFSTGMPLSFCTLQNCTFNDLFFPAKLLLFSLCAARLGQGLVMI